MVMPYVIILQFLQKSLFCYYAAEFVAAIPVDEFTAKLPICTFIKTIGRRATLVLCQYRADACHIANMCYFFVQSLFLFIIILDIYVKPRTKQPKHAETYSSITDIEYLSQLLSLLAFPTLQMISGQHQEPKFDNQATAQSRRHLLALHHTL